MEKSKINNVESTPAVLEKIETDLKNILTNERKGWLEFYNECKEVEKNELWKGKYKSWNEFINNLADSCKVHVSTVWGKISAGRTLNDYNSSVSDDKKIDPNHSHLTIENLNIISKIVKNTKTEDATKLKNDLIWKASNGNLSRDELRNAWKVVKNKSNNSKDINTYNNTKNAVKSSLNKTSNTEIKTSITALDIVTALSKKSWLWAEKKYKRFQAVDNQPCFKLFGEFECRSGTSKNTRRVDAMVVENHTAEVSHDKNHDVLSVYLHGIEIKVSKTDLLGDEKMAEYVPYCNYFYIAVPKELVEIAQSVALSNWGIISIEIENGEPVAKIIKKPFLNENPGAIKKSYQTALARTCISK